MLNHIHPPKPASNWAKNQFRSVYDATRDITEIDIVRERYRQLQADDAARKLFKAKQI